LRVTGRKAVTIKGRYGSPEFAENYRSALVPVEKKGLGVPRQGTVASLARAYIASAHFAGLASETKRHKRSAIETFAKDYGEYPVDRLEAKHVRKIIEGSPGRGRTLLAAISALMTYAVDMGWRDDNPVPGGLTHYFRLRCKEAGLTGCPPHGLRKAGARLAVEAECDITEIAAIGGWKSVRELQRYIEDFNRQKAARRAGAKIRKATLTRTQRADSRTRRKNA
jgi:integrase